MTDTREQIRPVGKAHAARRPRTVTALVALLVFAGLNGLAGGIGFLSDVDGGNFGWDVDILDPTPIGDYTLPGLWLLLGMGIYPIVVAILLTRRPTWALLAPIERWTGAHWTWTAALLVGLGLTGWIAMEWSYLGWDFGGPYYVGYGGFGLVLTAMMFLPVVRKYCARRPAEV